MPVMPGEIVVDGPWDPIDETFKTRENTRNPYKPELAAPPPGGADAGNPFSQFVGEKELPAQQVTNTPVSLWERFKGNFAAQQDYGLRGINELTEIQDAENGYVGGQFVGKEAAAPQAELLRQRRIERQSAYERMPGSETTMEYLTAIAGGGLGGVADPISILAPEVKIGTVGWQAAHPIISKMLNYSVSGAATNAALNFTVQAEEMGADLREDFDFDWNSIAIDAGAGGLFGAVTGGVAGHSDAQAADFTREYLKTEMEKAADEATLKAAFENAPEPGKTPMAPRKKARSPGIGIEMGGKDYGAAPVTPRNEWPPRPTTNDSITEEHGPRDIADAQEALFGEIIGTRNMTTEQLDRVDDYLNAKKSGDVPQGPSETQGSAGPGPREPGQIQAGTIDLHNRPVVQNADGTISTVKSMSINVNGQEVLIPMVSPSGVMLTEKGAVALYERTGQHLGIFDTPEHATAYAEKLHNDQAREYGPKAAPAMPVRGEAPAPGEPVRQVQQQEQQKVRKAAPLPIGRDYRDFSPSELKVDAKRFQFKEGGDEAGATDRLKGVKQWDQTKAGITFVWEDLAGNHYVADGHQRVALAKRLEAEGQSPKIHALILKESEGYSPEKVRAIAAAANIAQGTGTAIDAAKILRAAPDAALNLPPNSALVRDAQGLAKLSDDAFGMVVNKKANPGYAAIVGRLVPDKATHSQILGLLGDNEPENSIEAESMIRDAIAAPAVQETMDSLFGSAVETQILFKERAQVLSSAATAIRKDRAAFNTLVKEEGRLTKGGNKLATKSNAERAEQDAKVLAVLQAEARRKGPIADALAEAAAELRIAPGARTAIVGNFLESLRGRAAIGRDDRSSARPIGRPLQEDTPLAASLGGYRNTDQPAFRKWFGPSKVVDPDGEPMVVWHSGSFDEATDKAFDTTNGIHFGTKRAAEDRIGGKPVDDEALNARVYQEGARFYLDEEEWPGAPDHGFATEDDARTWVAGEAGQFDYSDAPETNLTAVYLSLKNPKRMKDQQQNWTAAIATAKAEGYDGIVYRNEYEDKGSDSYIAFDPKQIKSIYNRGTWDAAEPNISFSVRQPGPSLFDEPVKAPPQEPSLPKGVTLKVNTLNREVTAIGPNGDEIGYVSLEKFGDDAKKQTPFNTAVQTAWQRKGIASAMYREAEKAFGKINPSPVLSDEGFRFWKSYRPEAVKDDLRNWTKELIGKPVETHYGPGKIQSVGAKQVIAGLDKNGGKTTASATKAELERIRAQFRTEPGAEGRPQTVIPGAERATQAQMAQRGANATLRAKAPQKALDIGLFGDGHTQLDLVDLARVAPMVRADSDYLNLAPGGGVRSLKIGPANINYSVRDGEVEIHAVRVPIGERGQGAARAAMIAFLEKTDAADLRVKSFSTPLDKTTDREGVIRLYEGLGFTATGRKINRHGDIEMVRHEPPPEMQNLRRLVGSGRLVPLRDYTDPGMAQEVKKAYYGTQPERTLDELYAGPVPKNQRLLSDELQKIADELGLEFYNPGPKDKDKAAEKILRKGYTGLNQLTDLVRGGLRVETPEQAQRAVHMLAEKFMVLDEGWNLTPNYYFDRKLGVTMPDGTIAEVQFWQPDLIDAKMAQGHALYEEWRHLPFDDPRSGELMQAQIDLYRPIYEGLDPSWGATVGRGGKSQPANVAASSPSSARSRPESATSAPETGIQSPPGSKTAQARPESMTAGRDSQSTKRNMDPLLSPGGEWRKAMVEGVLEDGSTVQLPAGEAIDFLSKRRKSLAELLDCVNAG